MTVRDARESPVEIRRVVRLDPLKTRPLMASAASSAAPSMPQPFSTSTLIWSFPSRSGESDALGIASASAAASTTPAEAPSTSRAVSRSPQASCTRRRTSPQRRSTSKKAVQQRRQPFCFRPPWQTSSTASHFCATKRGLDPHRKAPASPSDATRNGGLCRTTLFR